MTALDDHYDQRMVTDAPRQVRPGGRTLQWARWWRLATFVVAAAGLLLQLPA
jgi:hypothetical protein